MENFMIEASQNLGSLRGNLVDISVLLISAILLLVISASALRHQSAVDAIV